MWLKIYKKEKCIIPARKQNQFMALIILFVFTAVMKMCYTETYCSQFGLR